MGKILPVGEWLPDQADFGNPGAAVATNVVPATAGSYGPMASPVVYSDALGARCQGSYSLVDNGGNTFVFAGDVSKLYLMKYGAPTFADVSKVGGYATPAFPVGFWGSTSFGTRVIFTNKIDAAQSFNVGTDTVFSDLSADAPKAQYCAVVRDFLMVADTVDGIDGPQPRRVWWPAVGDPTYWPTPGTDAAVSVQSDFQDLEQSDLGAITGIVGGHLTASDGAVWHERGIDRVAYTGSPDIFDFKVAEGAAGTQAPLSLIPRRIRTQNGVVGVVGYLGEDGFYAFDGASSAPIGAQKVDKTFFRDLDPAYLGNVQGVADPIHKLWFWAYHGQGNAGFYNRLLAFNWDLQRWALCEIDPAEWFTRSLTIGYTLDTLDLVNTNLDLLPFSLDSRIWTAGKPVLGVFDTSHRLNHTTGDNLAPTVETSEMQMFPSYRTRLNGARPLVDGGTPSVATGYRDRLIDAVTYTAAVPLNVIGNSPQRASGRYVRFRVTLPAASSFSHIQGVDADGRQEGRR